jgi:hypothetical protein
MADLSEPISTVGQIMEDSDQVLPEKQGRGGLPLRTIGRLTLGGALLAMDTFIDWLRHLEEEPAQATSESRDLESVLIPAEEWETVLGRRLEPPPRYVLLGFALDTQSRLSRTMGSILRAGDRVVGTIDRAINPVLTSRALSPVRGPFESLVERGEAQVNHWRELGRAEEARSRALAQDAATQLIDTSVHTVGSDPRIQKIVQEIVQQQGMGMADEAIEEVRERTVTGDMLLERPVRSILRRRPRKSVPASPDLIRNLTKLSVKDRGR